MTFGNVNPAMGCTVKEVFRGNGALDKQVPWKLDPGFQFVTHTVQEDPPRSYTVIVSSYAQGRATLQEQSGTNANFSASAVLKADAGPIKGGVETSVSKKEDQMKKASLDVETNGELVIFGISGGKGTWACCGEVSAIRLYIHLKPSGVASGESSPVKLPGEMLGGSTVAQKLQQVQGVEEGERNAYVHEQQEDKLRIRAEIESDKKRIEQRKALLVQQLQQIQGMEEGGRNVYVGEQQEDQLRIRAEKGRLEQAQKAKEAAVIPSALQYSAQPIPPSAFGARDWVQYFGDVGVEPRLPPNIDEILESPCPIWSGVLGFFGKKIKETHMLVLIPKMVNENPFTLDSLKELIKHPRGGGKEAMYAYYNEDVGRQYGRISVEKSYWVLITRDILPKTRGKKYDEQVQELRRYADYQVPKALEIAAGVLVEYTKNGKRLLGDSPSTHTQCREMVQRLFFQENRPVVVGGFSSLGLRIGYNAGSEYGSDGLAAVRGFEAS